MTGPSTPRRPRAGRAFVTLALVLSTMASVVAWSDGSVHVEGPAGRAPGSRSVAAQIRPSMHDGRVPPPGDIGGAGWLPGSSSKASAPFVIGAAGDVACDTRNPLFNDGQGSPAHCRAADTKRLLVHMRPDVVLALGDTQYDDARWWKYRVSYALSWGRLRGRTRPAGAGTRPPPGAGSL